MDEVGGGWGVYGGRESTCNSYKYVFTCRISCVSASILQMSRWRWDCTLSSRVESRLWLNSCDEITVAVAVLATVQHGGGNEWRMSLAVRRPVSAALAVHFSFFLPLSKQLLLLSLYFLHFPYYVFVGPLSLLLPLFFSLWLGIFTLAVNQPKITHTKTTVNIHITYIHKYL